MKSHRTQSTAAAQPGGLGSGRGAGVPRPAWGSQGDAGLPVCWRPGPAGRAGRENSQKECAGTSSEAVRVAVVDPGPSFFSRGLQGLTFTLIPGPMGGIYSGKAEVDSGAWPGHGCMRVCACACVCVYL